MRELRVQPEFEAIKKELKAKTVLNDWLIMLPRLFNTAEYLKGEPSKYDEKTGKPVEYSWTPYHSSSNNHIVQ